MNFDISSNNDEVLEANLDSGRADDDVMCTIKNLDNIKEFVVDKFREDIMWGKLKEVETWRHLTMKEFEVCVGHSPIFEELDRRRIQI
ncbi:hypothetical protein L1887_05385 [Cichorium endivia]|nr:hypothetical protein L1887_05385 [Cichorium endivia]